MIVPALALPLTLGAVCATALAAAVHVWRGRTRRDLLTIWLVAQAGFWIGHLAASLVGAPLYAVGDLQVVAGLAGGATALGARIVASR